MPGLVYRPRRPTSTPLYAVVQHHLETFLATAEDEDPRCWGDRPWVERDFRAYLRCGILAHGFARIRCGSCPARSPVLTSLSDREGLWISYPSGGSRRRAGKLGWARGGHFAELHAAQYGEDRAPLG